MAGEHSLVFLIIFYIVAFIYVKEPHYKYFGYIMLTIVYLFSIGIGLQSASAIMDGFGTIRNIFMSNVVVYNIFILCAFSVLFLNLYSLYKVLNAYWFKTKSMKSFDLKLNERHKQNLINFDNSFIVGNVSSTLLLISLIKFNVANTNTGINFIDKIITTMITPMANNKQPIVFVQAGLFLISFVCVWIEMAFATKFSYIKQD